MLHIVLVWLLVVWSMLVMRLLIFLVLRRECPILTPGNAH